MGWAEILANDVVGEVGEARGGVGGRARVVDKGCLRGGCNIALVGG